MTDSLKDLYNTPGSILNMLSDPFTVKTAATSTANAELGEEPFSGGQTDALRHLLGAATLAKRQGPAYASRVLNFHENPNIPFLGGYGQREVERQMDLHNNALGMEISQKAKDYDEALKMAKQYIANKKVKLAPPPEPVKPPTDVAEHDKNYTLKEWLNKYISK